MAIVAQQHLEDHNFPLTDLDPTAVVAFSFAAHLFISLFLRSRSRSQTITSETSMDESGVFEGLKTEPPSSQQLFPGLGGIQSALGSIPSGTITATPFQSSLVLGSTAGGGEVFIQMPTPREEGTIHTEGGSYHHRQQPHHYHHSHQRGASLLHVAGGDRHGHTEEGSEEQPGTPAPALSELKAVMSWLQKGLPFIMILLAKVCFQHKLGIALCIGMASTFAYANSILREQVSLKEKRSVLVVFWIVAFLGGNTLYLLHSFSSQQLYNSLIFLKPNLEKLDFFDLMWIVGITDFVLKYLTIALKCLVVALPKIILAVKSKLASGRSTNPQSSFFLPKTCLFCLGEAHQMSSYPHCKNFKRGVLRSYPD
uniref:E3 ubiquitin-protein ligase RNFT2 isoform X7 n=1 Tax=Pogona vitticeps TaxID=103695 RepID=A0ABM5F236_9SAUR